MHALKVYFLSVKYSLKTELQYKANFITGILANFYTYLIMYFSIWIITQKFKNLNGWDYNDLVFLLALNLFSYAIATSILWNYIASLEKYINEGLMDRLIIRPINPVFGVMLEGMSFTSLGQALISGIFLVTSIINLDVSWSIYKILYLVLCIFGGIFIQCAALIFFGSLSFWLKKSYDIAQILYWNVRLFVNYPLSIYSTFVKIILTYILPWAFINYYPAVYILDKQDEYSYYYLLNPLLGSILLFLSIIFAKKGFSKYKSVGH